MTIRRNVDLARINDEYSSFEAGCDAALDGSLDKAKEILFLIGTQCDALIGTARAMNISTCNCDGIREIEVLMFDMIRRSAVNKEITQAIYFGQLIENYPDARGSLAAALSRDPDFTRDVVAVHRAVFGFPTEAAEQQQDGTWAIMSGGGFLKGGFATKELADAAIFRRRTEAEEATR